MNSQQQSLYPYSLTSYNYPNTCTIKFTNKTEQQEILSRIKQRLGTSMPIISTVSYSVLANEGNNLSFIVEFEKIVKEVFGLGKLTLGEGAYLIKQFLLGAQILILKYGGLDKLKPSECFYGINSKGQAKMWLNRDYTDLKKCKKQQDKTKFQQQSINISKFISFLFCMIQNKVNTNECEIFKEIAKKMIKGKMKNFSQAYQKLKNIIYQYQIIIPLSLRKICFNPQNQTQLITSIQKPRLSFKTEKNSVNTNFLRKMKSINNEGQMLLLGSMKERNLSPAVSPNFRPFKLNNKSQYSLSNKRPKTNYIINKNQNSKLKNQRHFKLIDSYLTNSIKKKPSNKLNANYLVNSLKSLKQQKTNSNNKMSQNNFFLTCSYKKNNQYQQNVIINQFNPLQEQIEQDQISSFNQNKNNFTHSKTDIKQENVYLSHQIKDHEVILKQTQKCNQKSKQIPKFLTSLLHNKNMQLKTSNQISSSPNQTGAHFFLKVDKKSMTTTQASGMEANFNKDSIAPIQLQKQKKILPKSSGENLVVFQEQKEILNSIVIETPIGSFRSFEEDQLNNSGKGYDFGGLMQVESKVLKTSPSDESFTNSIEGKSAISLNGSHKSLIQNMKQSEQLFKIDFDIHCGMELINNFFNSKDIKESFFCGEDKKASFLKLKLSKLDKLGREINDSYTY